ncbi:ATP-dependent helicase HrpB [Erwinia psidii]|uniref:ATP-dependent helicase HrpB n=1 Tax=Erwinia psidii TaxID=69224 RepID=UPI00226B9BE3|nr:ATP-dependent helicase HrpB [Erwinia psidii]MCX8957781.1 ATP-dependent helicase HrpB [Erwinia psidii]MCX8960830.1 ATP-dependent helicase HrpB [Erwinia psidii]MCX8964930.1 ATP-dependent helicase HrpB [Erwinia psidii]
MSALPVSEILSELLSALQRSPQVLLAAPPGAGKSTWLPLHLLQQGDFPGKILLLEPRRLAARNVAQRLAEQLGESPGKTVGYRMRSESRSGPLTRLEVVTEGILTRMLQQDPMLEGVSLVILDEFHERSLQADLALALLLDVQDGLRDDLKILLMSATLDNPRLQTLLPDAPTVCSEGRAFPVERRYVSLPASLRFDEAVARQVSQLLRDESGSLLLFLPGVGEIQRVQAHLMTLVASHIDLCPLYGALPLAEQRKAILPAPAGRQKVVLATNIAETSLTIEGIRLVVDSALERVALFDPRSGLTRLQTQRVSQASMTQRAGRAGRLEPGLCVHLIAREQAERAASHADAEILNSDLAALWLDLLQWGCHEVTQLRWLDLPPARHLDSARQLLMQLGATDASGKLTVKGRRMAVLGSEPRFSAMLADAAGDTELAGTAALLVAILEEPARSSVDLRDSFHRRQPGWQQRAGQLLRRLGMAEGDADSTLIAPLLARAFPDRIARRRGAEGRYQLANGSGASLNVDEALTRYEWLIAPGLLQGSAQPDARILQAAPLDIEALIRQQPERVTLHTDVEWDEQRGTLRAWRRQQIGELVLTSQPLSKPDEDELHPAMLRWVRLKGLSVLNWTPQAEQLRLRMVCAARWLPEENWPAAGENDLLASLESWLLPAMRGVRDARGLKQIDVAAALLPLLTWSCRQQLDTLLPTHYTVPSGNRLPVRYDEEKPPVLAVRLQEMFGEAQNPCVAGGRLALVLELLSPAQRPVQITRDLAAFWQGAYPEVRKEMKGRYPKHLWPDDPANAQPTRRTKKFSAPS